MRERGGMGGQAVGVVERIGKDIITFNLIGMVRLEDMGMD